MCVCAYVRSAYVPVRVARALDDGKDDGREEVSGRRKTRASGKSKMPITAEATSMRVRPSAYLQQLTAIVSETAPQRQPPSP